MMTEPWMDAEDDEEQPVDDAQLLEALRTTFDHGEAPNDTELQRMLETIRDQGTLVTDDGEYSLDEVGSLVFVPYPPLDRA